MRVPMTAIRALCVGVAFLALAPPLRAEKPEISALIDQLISPNPEPLAYHQDPRPSYKTPEGFDAAKQEQVYKAQAKLLEIGPAAFPYLIERWDDKRYSLTTQSALSCVCHNETVGMVCRTILCDQLQPYGGWPRPEKKGADPRGKTRRPKYPQAFLASAEDAKAWWEKHKDLSLQAMQLMVLEWVQAEEAKRPEDFTDKERAYLEEIRDKLVTGGEPLKPGNYGSTVGSFRVQSSKPGDK